MLYITRLYCMYLGSAVCVILQTSQYYWKVLRPTCNGPAERGGGGGKGVGVMMKERFLTGLRSALLQPYRCCSNSSCTLKIRNLILPSRTKP